jgi:hypothetical protein
MGKLNAAYLIKDTSNLKEAKNEAYNNYCIQYFNQIKDKINFELTTTTKDNQEYILCSADLPVITKKIKAENIINKSPKIENQENLIEEILTDEEKEKEKKEKKEKEKKKKKKQKSNDKM